MLARLVSAQLRDLFERCFGGRADGVCGDTEQVKDRVGVHQVCTNGCVDP